MERTRLNFDWRKWWTS